MLKFLKVLIDVIANAEVDFSQIHSTIQDEYHSGYVNIKDDDFCGYRCLAHSVYGDEKRFWDVKMKMRDTLLQNSDFYKDTFFRLYFI